MNNQEKNIKHLAEKYYYTGKSLSETEFNILKKSKYSNILREKEYKSSFDRLVENNNVANEDNEKFLRTKKRAMGHSHMFNIGINRGVVRDIIDEIEEEFEIGIENIDNFRKYDNISMHDVRRFLKFYILKRHENYDETYRQVEAAAKASRSIRDLLNNLEYLTI